MARRIKRDRKGDIAMESFRMTRENCPTFNGSGWNEFEIHFLGQWLREHGGPLKERILQLAGHSHANHCDVAVSGLECGETGFNSHVLMGLHEALHLAQMAEAEAMRIAECEEERREEEARIERIDKRAKELEASAARQALRDPNDIAEVERRLQLSEARADARAAFQRADSAIALDAMRSNRPDYTTPANWGASRSPRTEEQKGN